MISIKTIIAILFLSVYLLNSVALAACIGEKAIWGTGNTNEECEEEYKLKRNEKRIKIEERKRALEERKERLNNDHNERNENNLVDAVTRGVKTALGGSEEKQQAFRPAVWDLTVSWLVGFKPEAYQANMSIDNEMFVPDRFKVKYWVNDNLSVILDINRINFNIDKGFEAITTNKLLPNNDGTGDELKTVGIAFPGNIEEIKLTSYHLGVGLRIDIDQIWKVEISGSVGQAQLDVKYGQIDTAKYNTQQPENFTIAHTSIEASTCLSRWTSGLRYSACAVYFLSQLEKKNYLDYIPGGGLGLTFEITIPLDSTGFR